MARKQKSEEAEGQLSFDFESVIEQARVLSRDEVLAEVAPEDRTQQEYDPVGRTADYMRRSLEVEEAWETTLQEARDNLLGIDPRELYYEFILDLKKQIEQRSSGSAQLASLLEHVAFRGLGMSQHHLQIRKPLKGSTRWRVDLLDKDAIRDHLAANIEGDYFLNELRADEVIWQDDEPLIAASDVSQHRSAVPVPARFFRRSVPFVLNNAAGTMFRMQEDRPKYDPIFNPKPDESLLRWMLIDPSYQDELESEDYQRCVASAMDVGQYRFDLNYLLKADKRAPDLIFRDGSLFPQDAYLDNFLIENRRGEFTREAIRELLDCVLYARDVGVIYCGVVKTVLLKVFSAVLDWFISKHINSSWGLGGYTLNDGQAMSLLLASPSFVESDLTSVISTCLIRRSFTTRANLNRRADLNDLDSYFRRHQNSEISIMPYKRLCEVAHAYMFFLGHSKSPQQQLPRYEFFYHENLDSVQEVARKILAAVRHCGLAIDQDHSFMSEEPIRYLLPSVAHHAHKLSKDVGKQIDRETGQWIMARYMSMIRKEGK